MSKSTKVSLGREEQIQVALSNAHAYEAAKRAMQEAVFKLKSNLTILDFDADIEAGLWSLYDNTKDIPMNISGAVSDSEIHYYLKELQDGTVLPYMLADSVYDVDRGTHP